MRTTTRPARLRTAQHRRGRHRAALACAALLLVGGCGGGEAPVAPETSTAANGEEIARADVELASSLLQRHAEALAVIDLTLGKQLDPQLQSLVEELRTEHSTEVSTLTTLLTDWGEEVPETVRDHVNAGHGHGEDEGAEHDEGHGELVAAEGERFAELWVPEMVAALEACVEVADAHDGHHAGTAELADSVVEGHRADIEALEALR